MAIFYVLQCLHFKKHFKHLAQTLHITCHTSHAYSLKIRCLHILLWNNLVTYVQTQDVESSMWPSSASTAPPDHNVSSAGKLSFPLLLNSPLGFNKVHPSTYLSICLSKRFCFCVSLSSCFRCTCVYLSQCGFSLLGYWCNYNHLL